MQSRTIQMKLACSSTTLLTAWEKETNPTLTPSSAIEVKSVGETTAATPITSSSRPSEKQALGAFDNLGFKVKDIITRIPSYFTSTPKVIPEIEQLFKEATEQRKQRSPSELI